MKSDLQKLYEIFNWLGGTAKYKIGTTNKEVLAKFGITYKDAWNKLKSRKKSMFYEGGRWYRWE